LKNAVVLDIGSSKVVSICASRIGLDGLAVHGADIRSYNGYRFGEFSDISNIKQVVLDSLKATERECGFYLRDVVISIPAPFTELVIGTGKLSFESAPKRITGADIDKLISASLPQAPPEGCRLIHSTPFSYVVDGAKKEELNADTSAAVIEAEVSHVYARESFLKPVQEAIKQADMRPGVSISTQLGQALMLIPEKERQKPTVLLDVGYTHTDISIVLHSAIVAQKTLEVGGMHLAGDLAYGLDVPIAIAEPVKRRYVFSLDYQDSIELVRTPQGTYSVERSLIQYIIEERAHELCYMIVDAIAELGIAAACKPAIHLTGGGLALMRGSLEYLEKMLGLSVRRDMPWMPRMNSPNYASTFGTLEFALNASKNGASVHQAESGVFGWLKELFIAK